MKRIFKTILLAISTMGIELDKTHVNFPQEGGQNTVTALNYTRWWINGGYESTTYVDDHWEYTNYFPATSSGGEETYTYDVLDAGWQCIRAVQHIAAVDMKASRSGERDAFYS